jgi:hypothetical protein
MSPPPRITLISALAQSPGPATAAMREQWPEALFNNLLDDSLARDLAAIGTISADIFDRFLTLGRYAAQAHGGGGMTAGLLFTCSAFGPAIDRVKADLPIPVVAPNEGAFEEALDICRAAPGGGQVGLLLSFAGSVEPLSAEMRAMAEARGQAAPVILSAVAEGALKALQAGDADRHDWLIAEAAAAMPPADALVIGQFSMARTAPSVAACRPEPVLTTPHAAVRKLRRLVEQAMRRI